MANTEKMSRNAKGVFIEQPGGQKHAQPAKGLPINKQKRIEMLEECLLSNHKQKHVQPAKRRTIKKQKRLNEPLISQMKRKNMHNQLKDGQ